MNEVADRLFWPVIGLVFWAAALHYCFLWIHVNAAALRERIVFALLGIGWTVIGTLAGFAALHVLERDENAIGDALLFIFLVTFGMPLGALGLSSIIGSLLPNGAGRKAVSCPHESAETSTDAR